jgi:hypothetical protein
MSMARLGHVYAVSGKKSEARALLNELKRLAQQEYVPADGIALIYAGLGEKDQAFVWLEKAYDEHSYNMAWLKVEPGWDSLRGPKIRRPVATDGTPAVITKAHEIITCESVIRTSAATRPAPVDSAQPSR